MFHTESWWGTMCKSLTVPATVIELSPSATQYSPLLNEGQEKSSSTK